MAIRRARGTDEESKRAASIVRLPVRRLSPMTALGRRMLYALGLMVAIVLLVWADLDGYVDNVDPTKKVSHLEAIYYATVTMTTTGYGDIVPYTTAARMVNAFLVTPLRIMFLVLLVGTTLEVLTSQTRDLWRVGRWRKRMQDHIVVVGYDTKGRSAVTTLLSNDMPKDSIVGVDASPAALDDANAHGLAVVVGDGTRRDVLRHAEVKRARQVVITLDRDDSAVLATLTVRQLNPDAYVVVAVREQDNVPLVRQSGVDAVITSSEAVGRLLGLSTMSPSLGSVLEDLLAYGEGLEVAERQLLASEVGRQPQSLPDQVVAVIRDGYVYRYYEPTVTQLQPGDRLIVIRPAEEQPWAPRPGTREHEVP